MYCFNNTFFASITSSKSNSYSLVIMYSVHVSLYSVIYIFKLLLVCLCLLYMDSSNNQPDQLLQDKTGKTVDI